MNVDEMPIRAGTAVEATDGRLGTVDEVIVRPETGELAYLVVRRGWSGQRLNVGAQLVDGFDESGAVRLRATRDEAERAGGDVPADALLARADGQEIRIPILEERLIPATRPVDIGELRILKHVDHMEESVRQPVTRDDVTVERVPINRPLDAPVASRTEGEWLVIPVMEEVLVVQKRLMLKEELRIRRQQVVEEQVVRETVRRERLVVEDATRHGVHVLPGTSGTAGTPPVAPAGTPPVAPAGTPPVAPDRSPTDRGPGERHASGTASGSA